MITTFLLSRPLARLLLKYALCERTFPQSKPLGGSRRERQNRGKSFMEKGVI